MLLFFANLKRVYSKKFIFYLFMILQIIMCFIVTFTRYQEKYVFYNSFDNNIRITEIDIATQSLLNDIKEIEDDYMQITVNTYIEEEEDTIIALSYNYYEDTIVNYGRSVNNDSYRPEIVIGRQNYKQEAQIGDTISICNVQFLIVGIIHNSDYNYVNRAGIVNFNANSLSLATKTHLNKNNVKDYIINIEKFEYINENNISYEFSNFFTIINKRLLSMIIFFVFALFCLTTFIIYDYDLKNRQNQITVCILHGINKYKLLIPYILEIFLYSSIQAILGIICFLIIYVLFMPDIILLFFKDYLNFFIIYTGLITLIMGFRYYRLMREIQ